MAKKIIFYTTTDSPCKKDATGAFIPEAKKFAAYHGDVVLCGIPCRGQSRDQRAQRVYDELAKHDKVESVVFACHGHPTHFQHGFGIRGKHRISKLASILSVKSVKSVVFYCCSVARPNLKVGPYSLCGELHRCMRTFGHNTAVIGHTTAGHTTWNANVKVFINGDYAGKFIVDPGSPDWKKWCDKLRKHPTYRYQFPYDAELDLS